MHDADWFNRARQRAFCSLSACLCLASLTLACGSKSTNPDNTDGAKTPVTTGTTGFSTPPTSTNGDTPDASISMPPGAPSAADVATNAQTQAQVASAALDSATAAAATGASGAGSSGAYGLVEQTGENFDIPDQTNQKVAIARGGQSQDCYLGSTIAARTATSTPSWPESAEASSIFAQSKSDAATTTQMYVEPALLQYPLTTPTATLTLSTPFTITNMVEVILQDNRQIKASLADGAHTSIEEINAREEHRFWVAKNPPVKTKSAALSCGPTKGFGAKGSSGAASGRSAKVDWKDTNQTDGLGLLTRLSQTATRTKSYLPKIKGVRANTAARIKLKTTLSGERLVQWSSSTSSASAIEGASFVLQKSITHALTRTDQQLDSSEKLISTIAGSDEVRATAPLIIQEFRNADENVLAHLIVSGTLYRTATDTTGSVKWFSALAFSNVKFDHAHSTEICIPVAGTITLTVYDKEGGAQTGQVVITYTGTSSTTTGKIDPAISVSGDDTAGTRAGWMILGANRRCDFKM